MKTLFIDRKNAELEIEKGRLIVRIPDQNPHFSVPTNILEMLVISAPVRFSSTLMTQLTQEKVISVFINQRRMDGCTITTGIMHNDARRRLLQYQAINQISLRITYAKQLVEQKLRLQKALLIRALNARPDLRLDMTKAISRIDYQLRNINDIATFESLRGVEGAAGAAYFKAYQKLFAPSLAFNGRNRRPPLDPVNVVLSLTYTLLHAEAVRALFSTGFDPLLGFYHEPDFGRESLACDMVELFRPLAERWIWRLFAREILRPEHFSKESNKEGLPCILDKRGREIYYTEYEVSARNWRRLMRRSSRKWLDVLSTNLSE
jgi:CRISPR-associated protein Cas1